MNDPRTATGLPERLRQRIVATLDEASLPDAETKRRLEHARGLALAQPRRRPRWPWLALPLAATAAVAALVLALAVQQPAGPAPMPMTADADLLTLPEFDLVVEDPETFAWLLDQEPEPDPVEQSG